MASKLADAYTFVVRMWRERDDSGESIEWRGEITDVTNGRATRFRLVSGVIGALQKLMNGEHGRLP